MSPNAQRIAIAEECGWTNRKTVSGATSMWYHPDGTPIGFTPDYLGDLNAIHEAEMLKTDMEDGTFLFNFRTWLHTILGHDGTLAIHATAAQRSEAFLRCLNLWDDTK